MESSSTAQASQPRIVVLVLPDPTVGLAGVAFHPHARGVEQERIISGVGDLEVDPHQATGAVVHQDRDAGDLDGHPGGRGLVAVP